jgi:hypothetical protein
MGPANTKEKQWMVFTIAIMPSKFYTKKQWEQVCRNMKKSGQKSQSIINQLIIE